ncbi:hypothetical protein ILUMI_15399 [Ignelater luminosus]|uniref:Uncharacterized protein n=1 Tax=Ignelater luminosus TaxID=2038154 RepID=A0A8K0G954_IGNLU|nr:hypothetical protein ILUMI_15399 [Ignelater luminosus]
MVLHDETPKLKYLLDAFEETRRRTKRHDGIVEGRRKNEAKVEIKNQKRGPGRAEGDGNGIRRQVGLEGG